MKTTRRAFIEESLATGGLAAAMGDNYWPYGIEPNRKALEALFRYSYEQGLAAKRLTVEELFHPSTLELVES